MKKWMLLITLLLLAIFLIWWWMSKAPVSSGIYPERQAGLIVIEIDEEERMVDFHLPVRWIKTQPWEQPPMIDDAILYNEKGEVIAHIEGEFILEIDERRNAWNRRNVPAIIPFSINGEKVIHETGEILYPLNDALYENYYVDRLELTFNDERLTFHMESTYKLHPLMEENDDIPNGEVESTMPLRDQDTETNIGFLVQLSGATIEDIMYWLPGMDENYIKNDMLVSEDAVMDDYLQGSASFEGENFSLPLELESNRALLFFPYTDKMVKEVEQSIIHTIPYFKISDTDGTYIIGGAGTIYPFDREKEWEELLILPK
ncbi:hypothetical protein [Evansella cellulosilytica]|uniref:Uncharacterized protein n=1 Tax=Evansella cellulosilytica (strain ATCC 21833 / DSM 2522 / FERM P-1141 / JCM 9156 / N-4) TaxID=649639 RepID=E6TYF7_EVAC2|nr:hypothetical protein [Evansella cellulosilytica]ADU28895.1 hypothetical protein Bcell_0613 [Evansella cellulosilytica DSM 2522]